MNESKWLILRMIDLRNKMVIQEGRKFETKRSIQVGKIEQLHKEIKI